MLCQAREQEERGTPASPSRPALAARAQLATDAAAGSFFVPRSGQNG